MSNKTKNYSLTLPLQEELYDVDIFNENFAVVDENLGALNARVENMAEVSKTGSYNHLINRPCLVCKNTAEFKQALAMGARNIFLMPAEYSFTDESLTILRPVTIKGCGEDTVINLTGNSLWVSGDNVIIERVKLLKEDNGRMINITITSGYEDRGKNFKLRDCIIKYSGEAGIICKTNTVVEPFFIDSCVFDFSGELVYKELSVAYKNMKGIISNSCSTGRITVTNELPYPENIIINGCYNIERQV